MKISDPSLHDKITLLLTSFWVEFYKEDIRAAYLLNKLGITDPRHSPGAYAGVDRTDYPDFAISSFGLSLANYISDALSTQRLDKHPLNEIVPQLGSAAGEICTDHLQPLANAFMTSGAFNRPEGYRRGQSADISILPAAKLGVCTYYDSVRDGLMFGENFMPRDNFSGVNARKHVMAFAEIARLKMLRPR